MRQVDIEDHDKLLDDLAEVLGKYGISGSVEFFMVADVSNAAAKQLSADMMEFMASRKDGDNANSLVGTLGCGRCRDSSGNVTRCCIAF